MTTPTAWKDNMVVVRCDRCDRETEVHRRHFISATAFHAPIWCVGCVTGEERFDREAPEASGSELR